MASEDRAWWLLLLSSSSVAQIALPLWRYDSLNVWRDGCPLEWGGPQQGLWLFIQLFAVKACPCRGPAKGHCSLEVLDTVHPNQASSFPKQVPVMWLCGLKRGWYWHVVWVISGPLLSVAPFLSTPAPLSPQRGRRGHALSAETVRDRDFPQGHWLCCRRTLQRFNRLRPC